MVLSHFLETHLPDFGPYQDAMVTGEDTLWHSLLSPYLNLGLLHPMEVIQAVQEEYNKHQLNLNSVEGFIRQILGWREYMRGVYMYESRRDPNYTQRNWFYHNQPLPHWFWTGITDLNCLHQTLEQIHRTGYAHHIQRLMLLSNFNLVLGTSPQSVVDWFHAVFIDAYDWVMQTNVIGMGLFADGGLLASKPYAASANYINKMSNYCSGCVYNPKARTGEGACPFNFLYWDFLARHREKLQSQGRLNLILSQLDRIPPEELAMMQKQSEAYRSNHLSLPNVVI
jgi:deoxyribodipyrimidine photolyase-related protein